MLDITLPPPRRLELYGVWSALRIALRLSRVAFEDVNSSPQSGERNGVCVHEGDGFDGSTGESNSGVAMEKHNRAADPSRVNRQDLDDAGVHACDPGVAARYVETSACERCVRINGVVVGGEGMAGRSTESGVERSESEGSRIATGE